jgi:O-acetyl-ADP-ribose deacetylase (regulator of RNase III)
MGSGVALSIMTKWPCVKKAYSNWHNVGESIISGAFELGNVQFVKVANGITVANMIAQHDIITNTKGIMPLRYEELEKCLLKVAKKAKEYNATIHIPYLMGADRAGGDWSIIEEMIRKEFDRIEVRIYKYKRI